MTGPRLAERRWTPGEEKQLLEMQGRQVCRRDLAREINRTPRGDLFARAADSQKATFSIDCYLRATLRSCCRRAHPVSPGRNRFHEGTKPS